MGLERLMLVLERQGHKPELKKLKYWLLARSFKSSTIRMSKEIRSYR